MLIFFFQLLVELTDCVSKTVILRRKSWKLKSFCCLLKIKHLPPFIEKSRQNFCFLSLNVKKIEKSSKTDHPSTSMLISAKGRRNERQRKRKVRWKSWGVILLWKLLPPYILFPLELTIFIPSSYNLFLCLSYPLKFKAYLCFFTETITENRKEENVCVISLAPAWLQD